MCDVVDLLEDHGWTVLGGCFQGTGCCLWHGNRCLKHIRSWGGESSCLNGGVAWTTGGPFKLFWFFFWLVISRFFAGRVKIGPSWKKAWILVYEMVFRYASVSNSPRKVPWTAIYCYHESNLWNWTHLLKHQWVWTLHEQIVKSWK